MLKTNKNLIVLIEKYQETGDSCYFDQVFDHFQYLMRGIALKYTRDCQLLYDDLISVLYEKMWECLKNFDSRKTDNLENHLKVRLFRSAINFTQSKQLTYIKKRIPMDTTAEENAATFESGEAIRIEDYVVSRVDGEIKTDQDKLQLIKALTVNSDAITTAIVNEHLSSERPTYASIGSKVGVHYKKVERVIKGLAKNYDASQHGELNAFLSV